MTLVILAAIAYLILKGAPKKNSPEIWVRNIFLVMVLVFLLSPVQNPWYLCWTVPFLCIFHSRSLIFLTGLIGLYYLDFYLDYQDITQYSVWVAWLEYTPFYVYLLWELFRSKKIWKTIEWTAGFQRYLPNFCHFLYPQLGKRRATQRLCWSNRLICESWAYINAYPRKTGLNKF